VPLAAFAMTGWAFWRGRQIVIARDELDEVPSIWRIPLLALEAEVRPTARSRFADGNGSGAAGGGGLA
jgi:hypothetical protein